MRKAIVFVMLISLGCRAEPPSDYAADARSVESASQKFDSPRLEAEASLLAHLRSLSNEWTADTVHIYTPEIQDTISRMWGHPIKPDWEAYFYPVYGNWNSDGGGNIYAVGWLRIGPDLTGYVLRVPGRYWSSAMALWIYNDKAGRWLRPIYIADAYGDAGWSFQADAWLVDRDQDGYRDLVQRRTDWEMDLESAYAAERIVSDSISWRFFQSAFDQWGWQKALLGDDGQLFRLADR